MMSREAARLFFCLTMLIVSGCYRVTDRIEPSIDCTVQKKYFSQLKSPFPLLSIEEKHSDWGREMRIAKGFAQELDLYRAVSTYRRAEILIGDESKNRKVEMQYDILLCYYFGKRYEEAIESVDRGELANVDKAFPAYRDLLLILYECYGATHCAEKEACIYGLLQQDYPDFAKDLERSRAVSSGNLAQIALLDREMTQPSYLGDLLARYEKERKSVGKAQLFNALLPGAGYFYLGQKTSALTAFILNGLFITAAVEFFTHHHLAAGIITTSFEAGWYFGGIYGAGEEAKYFNERVFERHATRTMNEHNLFPTLMMQYSF